MNRVVAILGLVLPTPAWALSNVNFCIKLDKEFIGELAGDFWTDNSLDTSADGIYLIVEDLTDPLDPGFDGFTNPTTGCTGTINGLDSTHDYRIEVESILQVDGTNSVVVMNNSIADATYFFEFFNAGTPFHPPVSGTSTQNLIVPPSMATDALAIGGRAFNRYRGGFPPRRWRCTSPSRWRSRPTPATPSS